MPDIAFAVSTLAQYCEMRTVVHCMMGKRIFAICEVLKVWYSLQ